MAQSSTDLQSRPRRGGRRNRQAPSRPAPPVASQYFAPERRYLTERGPEIARLAAQVRNVTALVNAEKKFFDVVGSVSPAIVPVAVPLTLIPEGDDTQGRAGRSILAKSLAVRLHAQSQSAATVTQFVRVFMVKDNDPRGAAPVVGTLFQGGVATIDGMPVLDTSQGRFKWLFDETFVLGTLAGGQDGKVLNFEIKMDSHIMFIGTTGTIASAGQGAVFLFVMADAVTSNLSNSTYYTRLRYYDN